MSLVGRVASNHPRRPASDSIDDRRTPLEFFARLHAHHDFTVDAAASDENAMLPRYWTRSSNGLAQPWAGERVWCNPPYSNLRPWLEKAWGELDGVDLIVMLVPANRTEQAFWQELVEPFRDQSGSALSCRFVPKRIRFQPPPEIAAEQSGRPPFGCCLLTWEPGNGTDPAMRPPRAESLFG